MHYVELDINNLRRWLAGADRRRTAPTPRTTTATSCTSPIGAARTPTRPAELQGRVRLRGQRQSGDVAAARPTTLSMRARTPTATVPSTSSVARRATFRPAQRHRVLRDIPIRCMLARWSRGADGRQHRGRRRGRRQLRRRPGRRGGDCCRQDADRARQPAALLSSRAQDRQRRVAHDGRSRALLAGSVQRPAAGLDHRVREPGLRPGQLQRHRQRHDGRPTQPASIIADAVTLLSNNWNDIRSFNSPDEPGRTRRRRHRLSHGRRWRQERHVCAADRLDFGTGLRHRRRRAQLPAVSRELGWSDAELSWVDRQLLHQPPGRRQLQVLRRTSTQHRPAASTSTPTSCCRRCCRRARRCSATSTR